MIKCTIHLEDISAAMKPGVLDVLTLIPVKEILTKGKAFVMNKLGAVRSQTAWSRFWKNFEVTWMKRYAP